ncbi:MAG: N-methyl-L-tryptophan oxidase [Chloroflexi bacterium]|nr:MAG: N-methyl-L-tryptophan oxidase [Chloroflexota bacterium]
MTEAITPDVIVVGLGAAGAATLLALARAGVRAVGVDRFSPPHARGSTHGDTRITRLAIGEGEAYTPLAVGSHRLWRQLESETGAALLTQNGGLVLESPGAQAAMHNRRDFLDRTIACAERFAIDHEVLGADEIARRFPQFTLTGDERGYYEPGAGFVRPEACVAAQLALAERLGAGVRRSERVVGIARDGAGVRVRTDSGEHAAERVVVAAGPWLPDLGPPALRVLLTVYRQVLAWFALRPDAVDHSPAAMPVYIWELGDGRFFYGFPAVDGPGGGLKAAGEQFDTSTTADTARAGVDPGEPRALYDGVVGARLPGITQQCLKAVRCLYTVTPDGDFVVDWHPDIEGVLLVSPCSGHGFKHSPALGEAVASWLISGSRPDQLSPFGLDRPSLRVAARGTRP